MHLTDVASKTDNRYNALNEAMETYEEYAGRTRGGRGIGQLKPQPNERAESHAWLKVRDLCSSLGLSGTADLSSR